MVQGFNICQGVKKVAILSMSLLGFMSCQNEKGVFNETLTLNQSGSVERAPSAWDYSSDSTVITYWDDNNSAANPSIFTFDKDSLTPKRGSCGGTFIGARTKRFIITVGHCVDDVEIITLAAGGKIAQGADPSAVRQLYKNKSEFKVHFHPEYKMSPEYQLGKKLKAAGEVVIPPAPHDIALIELAYVDPTSIFSKFQSGIGYLNKELFDKLFSHGYPMEGLHTLVWGAQKLFSNGSSLHDGYSRLIKNLKITKITDTHIITKNTSTRGFCQGDSGSTLKYDYFEDNVMYTTILGVLGAVAMDKSKENICEDGEADWLRVDPYSDWIYGILMP